MDKRTETKSKMVSPPHLPPPRLGPGRRPARFPVRPSLLCVRSQPPPGVVSLSSASHAQWMTFPLPGEKLCVPGGEGRGFEEGSTKARREREASGEGPGLSTFMLSSGYLSRTCCGVYQTNIGKLYNNKLTLILCVCCIFKNVLSDRQVQIQLFFTCAAFLLDDTHCQKRTGSRTELL